MNQGRAQKDAAAHGVRWRRRYGGDNPAFLGQPVLWAGTNHESFNDSRIFLGIGVGGLGRVVPANGNLEGQWPSASTVAMCPAAPDNGKHDSPIFGTTVDGNVFAVSADLNNKIWAVKLPAGDVLVTAPTVWGDLVFVCADKYLYALNSKKMGATEWTYAMPTEIYYRTAPVITFEVDNAILVADEDGDVAKVAALDGTQDWRVTLPGVKTFEALTLGPDFTVYVPASDGKVYVLDPGDGHVKGQFDSGTGQRLTAIALSLDGSTFFTAAANGDLFAVDVTTDQEKWHMMLPAPPTTPPSVTPNEVIYIGVGHGFRDAAVVAVNREGVRWSVATPGGLVNGLAVGEDGTVYAVAADSLIAIQ